MSLTLHVLDPFAKEAKRLAKKYKNISRDLFELRATLMKNPKAGIDIAHGCYKIRLANSSIPTGKSGGFRIIYYYLDPHENLYLMSIYSKTDLENISEEKIIDILRENGLA